jgi:ABC-type bacteriocin/lantibiotic exporter with double-glycine peptidase domain
LILDESTSALDALTERQVLAALDGFLKNVTTIVISHRPFPTRWANRVVYLERGQIHSNSDATCSELQAN